MPRNGLAIDFAPELDAPDDFARAYSDMGRHLRLVSYLQMVSPQEAAPVIDQPTPCPREAWVLAIANLAYAGALLWRALCLTVREAPKLARAAFARASRPGARLGVFGWAYALTLTALLVWR